MLFSICFLSALICAAVLLREKFFLPMVSYFLFAWIFVQFIYFASDFLSNHKLVWVPLAEELVKALVIVLAAGSMQQVYGSVLERMRYGGAYGLVEYTTPITSIDVDLVQPSLATAALDLSPFLLSVIGNLIFLPFWVIFHGLVATTYLLPSKLGYASIIGPITVHYLLNFLLQAQRA
jgi:hypothetical protein